MSTPLRPRTTTAFFTQSMISFGVSLGITITGIGYLHDSRWIRGFLALGLLYVVTSSFTLAKCVRDRQEETALVSRVDQASTTVRVCDLIMGHGGEARSRAW
jgi:hypothetical protein